MSTPLPREWGCLSICNTNLGGQLLLLWGVSTWKSFLLASQKVSSLNAEIWTNMIKYDCIIHSNLLLTFAETTKMQENPPTSEADWTHATQGKAEKRNQDPAKFILYSSWKYVINSYNVIKEKGISTKYFFRIN